MNSTEKIERYSGGVISEDEFEALRVRLVTCLYKHKDTTYKIRVSTHPGYGFRVDLLDGGGCLIERAIIINIKLPLELPYLFTVLFEPLGAYSAELVTKEVQNFNSYSYIDVAYPQNNAFMTIINLMGETHILKKENEELIRANRGMEFDLHVTRNHIKCLGFLERLKLLFL